MQPRKLMSIIAVVLVLWSCVFSTACNTADTQKAVAQVLGYMPAVISLSQSVANIVIAFNPDDAALVQATLAKVQAGEKELTALAQSYQQKQDPAVWKNLVAVLDEVVADGDNQLINAMQIKNPDSRQKAIVVLASLSAALHTLDAFISNTQSLKEVRAKNAVRAARLRTVMAMWSQQDRDMFTQQVGVTPQTAMAVLGIDHTMNAGCAPAQVDCATTRP